MSPHGSVRVRLFYLLHSTERFLLVRTSVIRKCVMDTTCGEACARPRCLVGALSAHTCRVLRKLAEICNKVKQEKHKLEYPHHTVYPYITLGVMTQQKVCTTYPEILVKIQRRNVHDV